MKYYFYVLASETSSTKRQLLQESLEALTTTLKISRVAPSQPYDSIMGRSYYVRYDADIESKIVEILNSVDYVESHFDPSKRNLLLPFMFAPR